MEKNNLITKNFKTDLSVVASKFLDFENKIDVKEVMDILYEVNKVTKKTCEEIRKSLFHINNNISKELRNYALDIDYVSYNLGVYDVFKQITNLIINNVNKADYDQLINSLKPKQFELLQLIYENDGISSQKIKKILNIKSQYLYNLTNDDRFLKLVNIYKNETSKNVFYSLNLKCRESLKMKYEIKEKNLINSQFYVFKYQLNKDSGVTEENYGYWKINKEYSINRKLEY